MIYINDLYADGGGEKGLSLTKVDISLASIRRNFIKLALSYSQSLRPENGTSWVRLIVPNDGIATDEESAFVSYYHEIAIPVSYSV